MNSFVCVCLCYCLSPCPSPSPPPAQADILCVPVHQVLSVSRSQELSVSRIQGSRPSQWKAEAGKWAGTGPETWFSRLIFF